MASNGPRFCLMFFLTPSMGLPRCSGPNKSSPGWAMHSLGASRRAGFTPTTLTQPLINSLVQNCCVLGVLQGDDHILIFTCTPEQLQNQDWIKLSPLSCKAQKPSVKKKDQSKQRFYYRTSFKHKPKRVGECKGSFILKHPSVLASNRSFERWHEKEQNKCYYLQRFFSHSMYETTRRTACVMFTNLNVNDGLKLYSVCQRKPNWTPKSKENSVQYGLPSCSFGRSQQTVLPFGNHRFKLCWLRTKTF